MVVIGSELVSAPARVGATATSVKVGWFRLRDYPQPTGAAEILRTRSG
jgi:hypothetical protein